MFYTTDQDNATQGQDFSAIRSNHSFRHLGVGLHLADHINRTAAVFARLLLWNGDRAISA